MVCCLSAQNVRYNMHPHNKIISNFITKNKLGPSGSITLHPHEVTAIVKEMESSHLKIKHATESLAKANKRIAELEKEANAIKAIIGTEIKFFPGSDKMYVSGYTDAMKLFQDAFIGEYKTLERHVLLNKLQVLQEVENTAGAWASTDEPMTYEDVVNELVNEFEKRLEEKT